MRNYPSYLKAFDAGTLAQRSKEAFALLESCVLCPRRCRVNRLKGEKGFCRTGGYARVCSYMPHHGEEPPISGTRGSGAIFFSQCTMACAYCQNYEFSQERSGREVQEDELAGFMVELQEMGCHNINLVSPTHIMPQILKSLVIAAGNGLQIPLVYNTGGYELPEIVALLDGIVDIYLPDMRYGRNAPAERYSQAPQYPYYNQKAVKLMHQQVGVADIGDDGIIKRGLVIRHLVLPQGLSGTETVMRFVASELTTQTYISLMSQYTPYYHAPQIQELSRRVSLEEYEDAQKIRDSYGLNNGWVQESFGLERFAGVHIKPSLSKDKEKQ